jgi:hypothetical protein
LLRKFIEQQYLENNIDPEDISADKTIEIIKLIFYLSLAELGRNFRLRKDQATDT